MLLFMNENCDVWLGWAYYRGLFHQYPTARREGQTANGILEKHTQLRRCVEVTSQDGANFH